MKKRMLSMTLALVTLLSVLSVAPVAQAISANDDAVFVKQPKSSTCTVISCLNMLRRRAIIDGRDDWNEITYDAYNVSMTDGGGGKNLRYPFSVCGMRVDAGEAMRNKTTEQKRAYFLSLLANHPEGIVIYSYSNPQHAVLLTDYTDGTFYCVETTRSYPAGRIPLTSTSIGKGCSQDGAVAKIMQVWYITNRSGGSVAGLSEAATIQPGLYSLVPMCAPGRRLDVQDGATATGANVQIWQSNDTAAQKWTIEAAGDGYYKLISQKSGKVLDVADAKKTSGTNVQQCIWTDNPAQYWRFTDAGDGYYHITTRLNSNMRLDVNGGTDANGTNVQIWEANDSIAQKWKLVPVSRPAETDHTHQKGTFQFNEAQHPHYGYYQCSVCGANFTDGSTIQMSGCSTCNPAKAAVGAPSQPVVAVNGQSVAVSWDYTGSGEKFDVYLVQAPWGWENIKYHGTTTNRSYTFTNVTPGGYAAFVIARPNTNRVQSGWTDLSVAQPAAVQQPAVLAAVNSEAQRFVDFAVSQVGKKRADYGYNTSWCGYFVGWCSEQLGMQSILPPKKNSANGVAAYQYIINHGGSGVRFYNDRSDMQTGTYLTDRNAYMPQIGDIVIFSWGTRAPAGHLYIDHVGIVQKVENGRIYVVHGNYHSGKISGGIVCGPGCSACGGASWPLSSTEIYAYAHPNWATIVAEEPQANCDNGHTWGSWTTMRAATCAKSGQRERVCAVCGQTQEETIERLEHDYRLDRETDTTLLYVCANCGASYTVYQEPAPAEKGNMGNFTVGERYSEGMFRDVKQGDWFEGNVAAVYELGLMRGTGSGTFSPGNNVTLAEAVTLAARLHSIYYTGEESFPGYDGGNWYDPYVDYAKENGLISTNYLYTKPATREEFVHILAQALPEEALEHVTGRVAFADDGDIVYISDVELLQRAGIINGIPENGQICFKPAATITRAEVAAIVGRMAQPSIRMG